MTVLEHFIASGGVFISVFDSGSVNRADFPLFQGGAPIFQSDFLFIFQYVEIVFNNLNTALTEHFIKWFNGFQKLFVFCFCTKSHNFLTPARLSQLRFIKTFS